MWLHRTLRLVLMLLCLASGVVASLAYAQSTFYNADRSSLIPVMASSFCVFVVVPLAVVAEHQWSQISRISSMVVYAFHVAASVVVAAQFMAKDVYWRPQHAPTVILSLALGSCFLMGSSAMLLLHPSAPAAGDLESASTVCSEELSLNKTHERPTEIGNKASQKTLVPLGRNGSMREVRDASGSTLHSDNVEKGSGGLHNAGNQLREDGSGRNSRYGRTSGYFNEDEYSDGRSREHHGSRVSQGLLLQNVPNPESTGIHESGSNVLHRQSIPNLQNGIETPNLQHFENEPASPEDEDFRLVQASMTAPSTLNDYCSSNWMSPSLGNLAHFPSTPHVAKTPYQNQNSHDVHRSKSTSQLSVQKIRGPKRQRQKWQSIHDEKVFLEGVNENLLPSVLRQGVSPIQKSKSRFSLDGGDRHRGSVAEEAAVSFAAGAENFAAKVSAPPSPSKDDGVFPDILEGLEDIPVSTPPPWTQQTTGLRSISLHDWEQNKHQWLHQNALGKTSTAYSTTERLRPISFASASASAPSLHTYRRNSEGSNGRSLYAQESVENALTQYITPVARAPEPPVAQSTNSSPIRKVMGMFRRRGSEAESFSFAYGPPKSHKHSDSVVASMTSHQLSTASGKSSRSGSPRRAIKSFLLGHSSSHKSGSSFTYTPTNPPPVPPAPPPIPILFNMPKDPLFRHTSELTQPFRLPSDDWEVSEGTGSDQSRVSSLPSAIIGEYDKEKWRKLKELEAKQAAIEEGTAF